MIRFSRISIQNSILNFEFTLSCICERFLGAYESTDIIETQLGFICLSFGFKILTEDSILATSQIDDAFMCVMNSHRYYSAVFVRKALFETDRPMTETTGLSLKPQNCYISGRLQIYIENLIDREIPN